VPHASRHRASAGRDFGDATFVRVKTGKVAAFDGLLAIADIVL
jgi:hypothetical protein